MARGRAHTTLTEVNTGTNAQNWKLQPRTHCFESPICVTASDDDDKNDNSTRDRFCLSLLFTASINGWMKYSHFDAVGTHFDVVSLVLFFDFISLRATTALCLVTCVFLDRARHSSQLFSQSQWSSSLSVALSPLLLFGSLFSHHFI